MRSEEIADRLEIADVLYRYCRAVDRGDIALLKSVYHTDAYDNHGSFKGKGHDFAEYLVLTMDRTPHVGQHHITNILIALHGDRANVESYFIAYHPDLDADGGKPVIVRVGGRYLDRFERCEADWKIARRDVVIDWTEAPNPVVPWAPQSQFLQGLRREKDPSHLFFEK